MAKSTSLFNRGDIIVDSRWNNMSDEIRAQRQYKFLLLKRAYKNKGKFKGWRAWNMTRNEKCFLSDYIINDNFVILAQTEKSDSLRKTQCQPDTTPTETYIKTVIP